MNDKRRAPRSERQHYVPQWILRGFTDFERLLHAWRINEQQEFITGTRGIFAATNINTAFSEDRTKVLAYSENAYTWLDKHGSRAAMAIRNAAREAVWHPRETRVTGATAEILSWFTGLPLRQVMRAPDARQKANDVADRFDLTNEQRQVLKVELSMGRLEKTENYLNTGRPTVLRTNPDDPLIVGDDIVVRGVPMKNGKASFLGVLIDQHTVLGRGFVHDRPTLQPDEVEIIELTMRDVEQINQQIASGAQTIAGSRRNLVNRIGKAESTRRMANNWRS